MSVADVLAASWENLWRNKTRTFLTAAGVIIGVAALVLMVSLGLGLRFEVLRLFETERAFRTLSVTRAREAGEGRKSPGLGGFWGRGRITPLTDEDLEEIRAIPGVAFAVPELHMILRVSFKLPDGTERSGAFPVGGAVAGEREELASMLTVGTVWSADDEAACLIPSSLLERLGLDPARAVGSRISFAGLMSRGEEGKDEEEPPFTLQGVIDSARLGILGNKIYLPIGRALELYKTQGKSLLFALREGTYLGAEVRVDDPRKADETARRLRNSGYEVVSASDVIGRINIVFYIFEGFVACIGAIGLVVSLFGIANTMAMAVLERTREIGIMKAVGARNRDVAFIFLAEAGAIGALGGAVGLAGAWAFGKILNAVARRAFDLPEVSLFYVSLGLAGGSILFSILVSVAAGYFPARRAARMAPVEALRRE